MQFRLVLVFLADGVAGGGGPARIKNAAATAVATDRNQTTAVVLLAHSLALFGAELAIHPLVEHQVAQRLKVIVVLGA